MDHQKTPKEPRKHQNCQKVNIVYGDQSASENSVNFLNYKLHRTTMKHFIYTATVQVTIAEHS